MTITTLLIANRGEIAIRIARAAAELGITSVAVFSEDDSEALHRHTADRQVALRGRGAQAYLDQAQLLEVARAQGCEAIHPGYGFLSENADFARGCADAGLIFVGPSPQALTLLGDKARARALAQQCQVPIAAGSDGAIGVDQARDLLRHGPIMLKALAGGGGRGMRAVRDAAELESAFALCQAEAQSAFGQNALYAERLIEQARHIEVQVIGDGQAVSHLWERDCSLQRQHQKLLEIAPAPFLDPAVRDALLDAALTLARACEYRSIGTFEFLLDDARGEFVFMEANPRLQVEHTITEAITCVDLVQTQLRLAQGHSLADLGLLEPPAPRGFAVQARINLERMQADGSARASGGLIHAYQPPSGAGIRVDGCGYAGLHSNLGFDSLLAKLVVQAPDLPSALRRTYRALCEFHLDGVGSNIDFLQNLLQRQELARQASTTAFIGTHLASLLAEPSMAHPSRFAPAPSTTAHGPAPMLQAPPGYLAAVAPSQGMLVGYEVSVGDELRPGQALAVLEAMKMQFVLKAEHSGIVHSLAAAPGDSISEGQALLFLQPAELEALASHSEQALDLDDLRADLAEALDRHAVTLDERRPDAVTKRRAKGQRTTRENLADLLDPGSFSEYGNLALAAQRRRRTLDELIAQSPADGLIAGTGTVNAELFDAQAARCLVLAYDYSVFAGTQGMMNHKKTDRLLGLARDWQLPVVLFAEGGGGRPGDTDFVGVAGLDCHTFVAMAGLSAQVPLVGVVSGRCFAGNAALLGCCHVIIATRNASIGMAGPAMIEGGGLGRFSAEEVGPSGVQSANGVIDVLVEDEAQAVQVAKRYLSYFQGPLKGWQCADQRLLRQAIPENRLRGYDVRALIDTLVDQGSCLELRRAFAPGLITALVRIEGRPFGLLANNPLHLGGAIDAVAGDKAARFMQLCERFGLPLMSLCDTPGFMVGPASEQQATVRHVSRMFVTAASLSVPFFTVVLRKGYGLGAQAMAAGSFHSPVFTIAWPSAEFGAMGLEGAVQLGFAKELAAQPGPQERQALFDKLVAKAYQNGKAINMASFLEIDAVIDPQDTRAWLIRGLNAVPPRKQGFATGFVDTW
ncbi:carboxyl transferase domain-containing protein [Pseudomonas sp. M47T1]|uniref:carboxyl transferase domain-containing protein n=1 Tax=Pseudomonas sp. M47T1 TaxID=1179778 RepID=UPI0005B7E854